MKRVFIFIIIVFLFSIIIFSLNFSDGKKYSNNTKEILLDNLVGMSVDEVSDYARDVDIELDISYEYSFDFDKDIVMLQDIDVNNKVSSGDIVKIVVSKGEVPIEIYRDNKVNELGDVPIMMYHGIVDIMSSDTKYIGGNVDKDGYNRTACAFRNDLEFYYSKGYRMISLDDYVDGIVDVELGKSPIILTFDDGNINNFRVIGEKNGELLIDPNCAVGILEEIKKKYPDYNVTATFFVNSGLFGQPKYNDKILNWLVDNGYDVGNHTMSHVDFTKVDYDRSVKEMGGLYNILDRIIPNKYVSIVALPFGSPYKLSHNNYNAILSGVYDNKQYLTKAALRVGWEAELSVFNKDFNPKFLKRIRAYDNEGKDFDIEMNFKLLENKRYISDGNKNIIVIREKDKDRLVSVNMKSILY